MQYSCVHWSAASLDEARQVCQELVNKKLVACAHIIPHMESIFLWKGQLEKAAEVAVIFKTKIENFAEIQKVITELASYEVPEILQTPITDGFSPYLNWMQETMG